MVQHPSYKDLERRVMELEKENAQIKQKNEILQNILNGIPDVIGVLLPDQTVVRYNRVGYEFLNLGEAEVKGKKCFELLGCSKPCEPCSTSEAITKKGTSEFEKYFAELGLYFNCKATPVLNRAGEVSYVIEILRNITEKKRAEEVFKESEERFRQIYNNMSTGVAQVSLKFQIECANYAYCRMLGYTEEELIGKHLNEITHPEILEENLGKQSQLARGEINHYRMEKQFIHKRGEVIHGILDANLVRNTEGEPQYMLGSVMDITERKRAEENLQESKEELAAIYDNAPLIMMLVDKERNVRKSNFFAHTSARSNEKERECKRVGDALRCLHRLNDPRGCGLGTHCEKCTIRKTVLETFQTGSSYDQVEACLVFFKQGQHEELTFLFSTTLLQHKEEPLVLISIMDITERKKVERELHYMSFHDSLTGLYNRNFFEEEMNRLQDDRYSPVGIVVCDLDGLKFINDTLGHEAGDKMLINTANILRRSFRSSDIIARIGGDEFAIQLTKTDPEIVEQILQRLRQAVHEYNNTDPEIPLSLSIGHALGEGETADMQTLFRKADNRMYREKLQHEGSARSAILQALTVSMEARDFNTENHCNRMQELASSVARSLNLSQYLVNDLYLLTRFHDLGKVGIPDQILFKPGPLTKEEWREMRQHCVIGHRIASSIPDLEPIADYILKHHEWWDGQGYPLGLSGRDIPLLCRILAITDAYDAMTSERPYRKTMTREEAIAELRRFAGKQFDPELVEQFIQILEQHDS